MELDHIQDVIATANEFRNTIAAIRKLDEGGRIGAMTIASPDDPTSVTVITETFGYPQQMVEAIRGQLEARRTVIVSRSCGKCSRMPGNVADAASVVQLADGGTAETRVRTLTNAPYSAAGLVCTA